MPNAASSEARLPFEVCPRGTRPDFSMGRDLLLCTTRPLNVGGGSSVPDPQICGEGRGINRMYAAHLSSGLFYLDLSREKTFDLVTSI